MAPALMEANANVSQSQDRNIKFINSKILDNISNLASSREVFDKDFNTGCTAQTKLTTNSGRRNSLTNTDNCTENSDLDEEKSTDLNNISDEIMNDQNNDAIVPSSSPKIETQCGEESLEQNSSATCASKETDGAKVELVKSQNLNKFTSYAVLKDRSMKTNAKLQSLDRRARSLREKLRDFQANRLITHVKKQAQLMDYTLRISNDPRQKHDAEIFKNSFNSADKQNFTNKSLRNLGSSNPVRQPSQLVNILKTNDSPLSTCLKSQQFLCGSALATPPSRETKLDKVSLESRKETFNILANEIEDLRSLNDPNATDPESDCDDDVEMPSKMVQNQKQAQKGTRKRVDEVWLKDRVKIGSMCTWIQAQIADLSHKIKKYGDFYQQVKSSRTHLILEEIKHPITPPAEPQSQADDDDLLGKRDLNSDSSQNNIFAKLQIHKNGLAKDFSMQAKNEIKYEKVSGARTLPANRLPKHQYVRRKIKRGIEVPQCPNLPTPFPCKQCQKASSMASGRVAGNLSAVYLDHNYHEQLSAKYDVQLPHVVESVLRKEKIFTGRKNLVPASLLEKSLPDKKDVTKNKHSTSKLASNAAATTNSAKMRLDRKRQKRVSKNALEDSEFEESPIPKKRAAALSAASQLQKRASSLRAPSSGSGESRPSTPVTENHILSSSYPSPSLSQLVKKKNRPSSEYDINNIVIPYSISSSTRLEKPQYKEILTPGWRPRKSDSPNDENNRDEFEEDTSDMAYANRHSQCEVTEHKRFTSYFQLPIRRPRSSRKSSECNTPEPYSPQNPDNSNSGFATTPTEFILATPLSGKNNKLTSFPAFSLQQEDNKVMGWPRRTFPLTGNDLDHLLNPDKVPIIEKPEDPLPRDILSEINTPVDSPQNGDLISPSENSPCDETDEKWTVKLMTEEKQPSIEETGSCRKGIVLKLAKK